MNKAVWLLLVLFSLLACKPSVPSDYIQPGEMEDILYDYHVGKAIAQLEDANREQREYDQVLYLNAVLRKHGVTKADFDSSLVYYYTRADRFEDIYKKVAKRLGDEALNLGASEGEVSRFATLNATGDTANVWEGNSSVLLMPYPPYHRMSFHQKADTTYRKGDSFMLSMMVDFIYQTGSKDGIACLNIRYDNDSIVSRVNHVTVSGLSQLRITNNDTIHAVKDIYGYLYLGRGNDDSSTLKLMFIRNIQLVRFRKQGLEPAQPIH